MKFFPSLKEFMTKKEYGDDDKKGVIATKVERADANAILEWRNLIGPTMYGSDKGNDFKSKTDEDLNYQFQSIDIKITTIALLLLSSPLVNELTVFSISSKSERVNCNSFGIDNTPTFSSQWRTVFSLELAVDTWITFPRDAFRIQWKLDFFRLPINQFNSSSV